MPPELRDAVESAAKDNGRSMNAEIVYRLEESFTGGANAEQARLAQQARDDAYRMIIEFLYEYGADDPNRSRKIMDRVRRLYSESSQT